MADTTKQSTPNPEQLVPGWESSADAAKRLDHTPLDDSVNPVAAGKGVEAKRDADKTSEPVLDDAQPHDEPVRTNRPSGRIVQRLHTGAGAHQPVDDPDIGPDGRPGPHVIHEASQTPSQG